MEFVLLLMGGRDRFLLWALLHLATVLQIREDLDWEGSVFLTDLGCEGKGNCLRCSEPVKGLWLLPLTPP